MCVANIELFFNKIQTASYYIACTNVGHFLNLLCKKASFLDKIACK